MAKGGLTASSGPATSSLHEAGTARLIFAPDCSRFDGVLINFHDEVFALRGVAATAADAASAADFDVAVVDGETGAEFVLRDVRLTTENGGRAVSLHADSLQFATEDVLVGNRADVEIQNVISPLLVGKGHVVHVGTMSIKVQSSATPPPTPSSYDASDTPMESDDVLQ